jgi:hypothetical protein
MTKPSQPEDQAKHRTKNDDRLAKALRENLFKRKAQARARAADDGAPEPRHAGGQNGTEQNAPGAKGNG